MKNEKLFFYTWPQSQCFIGAEGAILVLPPEDDRAASLDSAYLVPADVAEEVIAQLEKENVPVPYPEGLYIKVDSNSSQKTILRDENILMDYDGNVYKALSFDNTPDIMSALLAGTPSKSGLASDPQTRVVVEDENGRTVPVTGLWYDPLYGAIRLSIEAKITEAEETEG